jgi:hypothetical protein
MMRILRQKGVRAAEALLAGLAAKGLSVPPGSAGRLRVSKKGNLLLDEEPLLASSTAEALGARTPEDVWVLLCEMLSDEAARMVHRVLCSPKGAEKPRQLFASDFVMEPLEGVPQSVWTVFKKEHEAHSAMLAEHAEKVFCGLPVGLPDDARPVVRIRCRPQLEAAALECRGAVCVVRCSACGFAAVFSRISGRLLSHSESTSLAQDGAELTRQAELLLSRRLAEAGMPEKLKSLAREIEAELEGRIGASEAYARAARLRSLAESIRNAGVRWWNGEWEAASVRLPSTDPSVLMEHFERWAEEARRLPSVSVEQAREALVRFWEESGRAAWEKAEALWAELLPVFRILPEVRQAYEKLRRFAEALSAGRFEVKNRQCFVGGEVVAWLDGPSLAAVLDRLCRSFERAARGGGKKGLNMEAVFGVLHLLAGRPKEMGVTTVAAVLAGSRARKVLDRGYDKLPQYGLLKGRFTQEELVRVAEEMVRRGLVGTAYVGRHDLRVLFLPKHMEEAVLSRSASGGQEEGVLLERAERAARKRGWDELAEMASEGFFPARAALAAAAALWPSGGAAKLLAGAR